MATSVGLEIGTAGFKLAVLEGSPKKVKVKDFILHHYGEKGQPHPGEEGVIAQVQQIFKKNRIPRSNLITEIPGQNCILREITVPFTREDQIRKTIKFQAESHFHSISIDEILVEYYKFEEIGDKSNLLIAGLRKSLMEKHLQFLKRCEIDPVAVDLDMAATFNTFSRMGLFRGKKGVLVVDLGEGFLKILVVINGKIRTLRSLRLKIGPRRLAEPEEGAAGAAEDEFHYSELEGSLLPEDRDFLFDGYDEEGAFETGKLPVVILDEAEAAIFELTEEGGAAGGREPHLDKIFLEIDRTLASVSLAEPIGLICLTGEKSGMPGIEEQFQDYFQIETVKAKIRSAFPGPLPKEKAEALNTSGAAVLGLALKGLGYDEAGFNFRKEEFEYLGKFEKLKKGLACTLCLFFILFALLTYRLQLEERWYADKYKGIRANQQRIYYALFPEKTLDPRRQVISLLREDKVNLERGQGHIRGIPKITSALDKFLDFALGVQRSRITFKLIKATFVHESSTVTGKIENQQDAFAIERQVNQSKLVRMNVKRLAPSKKGGFDLDIGLKDRKEGEKGGR
jgi:Tfp pilus assembly PilM family ATPase